jgi:multicomponent Na+:H+ antiporter subunit G
MMLTVLGEIVAAAGVALIAAAAIGILRMPDVYNRINAVAKAAALGVSLVLAGVLLMMPSPLTAVVVVLAIAAQLFTAPIAGYAVGRAAYRSGAPLTSATYRDDLAARQPPPPTPPIKE